MSNNEFENAPNGDEQEPLSEGIEITSRSSLEDQLTAMEIQMNEFKDKFLRQQAEFDNFRKRAERDVQNAHTYGVEKLLKDLLPVVDSLERGLEGIEKNDVHFEGMQLTLEMFIKTLGKYGVSIIDPKPGDTFDPMRHEAMSMQPNPDFSSNAIIQVLQRGYELAGRTLRAAMVIVAK
jgi:molecular chaperone GrpE